MERSLLYGASALGVVGWILSVALGRSERDSSAWQAVSAPLKWTAIVLPLAVFLVTMPSSPPFAAGQGLGRGLLIGAVAAILAAGAIVGARRSDRAAVNAGVVTAPLWLALPAVALPVLFMRPVLMDALMGVAMGFLAVTVITAQGLDEQSRRSDQVALYSGAGFCAVLAAAAGLGAYRGTGMIESTRWSAAALLAGTAVPLSVLIASLPPALLLRPLSKLPGVGTVAGRGSDVLSTDRRRLIAASALQFVLGSSILLVCLRLVSTRLVDDSRVFWVAGMGLVVGFVAWWLANDGAQLSGEESENFRRPLTVLVALGAAMAAFNLALGFGIAIMALALWMPIGLALGRLRIPSVGSQDADTDGVRANLAYSLWCVAAFVSILAIYRFISTRFRSELSGVTLTDHYALFAFLAGATLPSLIAGVISGSAVDRPAARVLRLIAGGALILTLPAAVLILWKAKATLALLAGAALAAAGFEWFGLGRRAVRPLVPILAVAVCLALAQWTPQVLEAAALTRDQKIGLLKWVLGGAAAILVAVDLGERYRDYRASHGARPTEPGMEVAP